MFKKKFNGYLREVSKMFQGFFKEVLRVFQGRLSGVPRTLGDSREVQSL